VPQKASCRSSGNEDEVSTDLLYCDGPCGLIGGQDPNDQVSAELCVENNSIQERWLLESTRGQGSESPLLQAHASTKPIMVNISISRLLVCRERHYTANDLRSHT
jgi:hypothetical protein